MENLKEKFVGKKKKEPQRQRACSIKSVSVQLLAIGKQNTNLDWIWLNILVRININQPRTDTVGATSEAQIFESETVVILKIFIFHSWVQKTGRYHNVFKICYFFEIFSVYVKGNTTYILAFWAFAFLGKFLLYA